MSISHMPLNWEFNGIDAMVSFKICYSTIKRFSVAEDSDFYAFN